jgi:uncharacterized protein YfaS (alpha-2-macroglobulin family)
MLYVNTDGSIRLTRGDTARLTVDITNNTDGGEYTLENSDVLTLTVKKNVNETTAYIQKTITGSNVFYIEPSDTESMTFGSYKYDVQLTTAGGDVYTIIEPSKFEIMQEVTY